MTEGLQASNSTTDAEERAVILFRSRGGLLRTGEALRLGIHPRTLYRLRDAGVLQRLGRGRNRQDAMAQRVSRGGAQGLTALRMTLRSVV
jgi:hypothetical protein